MLALGPPAPIRPLVIPLGFGLLWLAGCAAAGPTATSAARWLACADATAAFCDAIAACAFFSRARSVSFCALEMNFFATRSLERL